MNHEQKKTYRSRAIAGMERLSNEHVLHPGIGPLIDALKWRDPGPRQTAERENQSEGRSVMIKIQDRVTAFWRDAINLVLGIWLIVSPFVLDYAAQMTPAWNAYAIGVVIAVLSAAALWQFQKWEEWLSAVLGAWLVVSPWLLGFRIGHVATWNQIVVGIVVGALAFWSGVTEPEVRGLTAKK